MVLLDEDLDLFYYYKIVDNYYYILVEVSFTHRAVISKLEFNSLWVVYGFLDSLMLRDRGITR